MDTGFSTRQALNQTIVQYVLRNQKSDWPLSMRQALTAIRKAEPDCALSDRELVDLIASTAIERNIGVHFDVDTTEKS